MRSLQFLAVLVLAAVAVLAAPRNAAALSTVTPSEDAVKFVASFERELAGLPTYEPGPAGDRFTDMKARAASQTTMTREGGQLIRLRTKAGLMSSAVGGVGFAARRIVPLVDVAFLTFQVGWEIGSALRPLVYKAGPPAPPASRPLSGFTFVEEGQVAVSLWGQDVPAPAPGFLYDDGQFYAWTTLRASDPCPRPELPPALPQFGTYISRTLDPGGLNCRLASGEWVSSIEEQVVIFAPLLASWPTPLAEGQTTNVTIPPVDAEPADDEIRRRIVTEFRDHPERYPDLFNWLGPNIWATVPDCRSLSFEQCRSALRAAGFVGTIRSDEIDYGSADGAIGAGGRVSTEPSANSRANPAADVTVSVNPDPLEEPSIKFPDKWRHFEDHAEKFDPPYTEINKYWRDAATIVERGRSGGDAVERCVRPNGDEVFWHFDTRTMVVVRAGNIVTYYPPDDGYSYFVRQCDREMGDAS